MASLRSSGLRGAGSARLRADEDPMASMANLADVMLVFACGLMIALVVLWRVDFANLSELQESQMEQIEDPEQLAEEMTAAGSSYLERGVVYQDPKTGVYYLLEEAGNGEHAGEVSSSAGSAASGSTGTAPDRASGAD